MQNQLTRLPESTCKLRLLTDLNVASNSIAYLPAQFGELQSLKRLNLHDNLLQASECKRMRLPVLVSHATSSDSSLC